ncbi:response regulator receiver protein [Spirochaeta thermophila DSM 6578]|uniref:Response regulator receiver protein n=1 Tax=Winmispira thermophila (strain ATCC 700085 / DSM 6578 / Z-1203) TaxID=869211 RepID=G0GEQ4_WINT7|nr:response regulator [Spirochaeta thermophila]AEJ61460.1 response regulator receiver protein [Spirochaeta thermophila DSM 6578]
MRFLIVEDDIAARVVLTKYLERLGECVVAEDGVEGFEAFVEAWEGGKRFDVVFLDIMMPRMDGQETLRKIREFERSRGVDPFTSTKVLMTTALNDPQNVIQAFHEGGAQGYLVKPIRKERLYAELVSLGIPVD